jgi:hypothetical protein
MKHLTPIPPDSVVELKRNAESCIGYQVASVTLKDGRHFDQVVVSDGFTIQVRGYEDIPFAPDEVAKVRVNHKHWNLESGRTLGITAARAELLQPEIPLRPICGQAVFEAFVGFWHVPSSGGN